MFALRGRMCGGIAIYEYVLKSDYMSNELYYHVFANGEDSKNLLESEADFLAAFNRVGICAAFSKARVLAFALEDTHPHFLLYGTKEDCIGFMLQFQDGVLRYIRKSRKKQEDVRLDCDILEIKTEKHLLNTGVYVIGQPTKDRKHVLPGDYRWGTGCLYFRPKIYSSVWEFDAAGKQVCPTLAKEIPYRRQKKMFHTHAKIPSDWLVCNGFILPHNYVDVARFEAIYGTHYCFNSFLNAKRGDDEVVERMVKHRGAAIETLEARRYCEDMCLLYYGKRSSRWLTADQRMMLAKRLRSKYHLSFKQLSALCRVPEEELKKYII